MAFVIVLAVWGFCLGLFLICWAIHTAANHRLGGRLVQTVDQWLIADDPWDLPDEDTAAVVAEAERACREAC